MPQELKLLFEILRRWPGGYSFGEYLNAVEQHQIRLRARPADDIRRPSLVPWQRIARRSQVHGQHNEGGAPQRA
ncbi:MAG: hypothetical protein QOD29_5265 [Alphaproteobacteria bacterium]|jgi:hypothetical protein|nr:hypothetical protein [Alphaproteobacteria bacterium]